MRVVGGKFKGRALATPKSHEVRPTSDRARESIFNVLIHNADCDLVDANVIDLFAGTGALGIEAMSRGAKYCLFVEQDPNARSLIRQNVDAFGLHGNTKIFRRDATNLGQSVSQPRFQYAFLDPPYGKGLSKKALAALDEGAWLDVGATLIIEDRISEDVTLPNNFELLEKRKYGDAGITFARYFPQPYETDKLGSSS